VNKRKASSLAIAHTRERCLQICAPDTNVPSKFLSHGTAYITEVHATANNSAYCIAINSV